MKSFVSEFLEYTSDAESPTSYFEWSAYATIAAVMRDSCWVDLGLTKIYPNIYVLLLSRKSSTVKKGLPLRIALDLVQTIDNTKIISGRATIPGIIEVLAAPKMDVNNKPVPGASCFIQSEELTALVVDKDDGAIDTLTNWYDVSPRKKWTSVIKSTGVVSLEGLCVTMLTSSNEALVRQVFTKRASDGGLLARTILVSESKRRHKNSLMYPQPHKENRVDLVTRLHKIAAMKGEFKLTDEARKFFHEWYNEFEPHNAEISSTGVKGRLYFHAIKLSMIISASEGNSMEVTKHHAEEAITKCIGLLKNYQMLAGTTQGAALENVGRDLLQILHSAPKHQLSRTRILWYLWSYGQVAINEIIETFTNAGIVTTKVSDGDYFIKLTKETVNRLGD